MIDSVVRNLVNALSWVMQFLPDSPFQQINNSSVEEFLGVLNWILPLGQVVAILQLWVSAILVFYAYKVILRWVKAIA